MVTEAKQTHTPTPWSLYGSTIGGCDPSSTGENYESPICIVTHSWRNPEVDRANAAHIVHCVNLHDELVETLMVIHRMDRRITRIRGGAKALLVNFTAGPDTRLPQESGGLIMLHDVIEFGWFAGGFALILVTMGYLLWRLVR